ncbi:hypothetical protein P8T80_08000 [Corynebacterium rouxii]|uniref:Phospholipase D-like domain-containing protein n=1 Tax=Corynebacterium rouxii TaxID=2719119 RepID=A0ABU3PPD7_9CORY|nr:hypothetical protein [Corynebacterium rouxii]MDT9411320.1 hypothetical protein [Corynebacterium rouxii]
MAEYSINVPAFRKELAALAKKCGVVLSATQVKHLADEAVGFAELKPAHVREGVRSHARFSKAGAARQTIAGFDKGMDVLGLTYGQFSLIDLVQATLEITGPADVTIATWSAGFYDLRAAENFRDCGMIRSIRFIMDSGRAKKGQAGVHEIGEIFGEDSFIQIRTHAKFVLVRNEDWDVCITSSMNLNKNTRCEQFEMTDDAERCEMFEDFVRAAFEECPESRSFGRTMPGLVTVDPSRSVVAVPDVSRNVGAIRMGSIHLQAG